MRGGLVRGSAAAGLVAVLVSAPSAGAVETACSTPWIRVQAPSPRPGWFRDVASLSKDDAWAVGSLWKNVGPIEHTPLIEHYGPGGWTITPTPRQMGTVLTEVAAVSSNDVWAGGYDNAYDAVSLHWDGSEWRPVPFPGRSYPTDIAAAGPGDVWASAGFDLYRWDGSAWTHTDTLPGWIEAIDFESATDGWAVGYNAVWETTKPFSAHWDGKRWTRFVVPFNHDIGVLNDVTAISPTDAWAVGDEQGAGLTYHWDGVAWSPVENPTLGLNGVAASGPNDVWAVGGLGTAVASHWDGSTWSDVPMPPLGTAGIEDIAIDPGRRAAWAVGWRTNGLLTLRHEPCEG